MAGDLGDADSVRRLGQALLAAGRGVAGAASELSGQVRSLVPSGWSGDPAEAFSSDWDRKAGQAKQLAAACTHVGQVLVTLAGELDAANRHASNAQQIAGGPASRFADPGSEHKSQRMLSQATGAAEQARAAARTKLAGIKVPRIGPPLTVSEVDAWVSRLAPGEVPVFKRLFGGLLGDARDFARRTGLATAWGTAENMRVTGLETVGQEAHFAEGIADGLTGMLRGVADLAPGPDGGLGRWLWGDQPASQAWAGLSNLAAPFTGGPDTASAPAEQSFGKGLLAWDEWRTDPARAAGNVFFNAVSLFAGTKLLPLKAGSVTDTGKAAGASDVPEGTVPREEPNQPPSAPPAAFGQPEILEISGDRPELPLAHKARVAYGEPRTPDGEPVPLFNGAPEPWQAMQGQLGDCAVIAAMRAVARTTQSIKDTVWQDPDGSVTAQLHEADLDMTTNEQGDVMSISTKPTGRMIQVRMKPELPVLKRSSGQAVYADASEARVSWPGFVEQALAAADRADMGRLGLLARTARKLGFSGSGYSRLGRATIVPEHAALLTELTGKPAQAVFLGGTDEVADSLARLLQEGKPVLVTTKPARDAATPGAHGLVAGHEYEVTGIEDGKVLMENPWGFNNPDPVPAEEFLDSCGSWIVTLE